ncbi:helix-turn-helix domain-containing protein [Paraburkholderia atlantica]|uniref:helix-turn-helix domain-containing protein n=1 Tax=Paraburkholderia atlantica TaxID=2654982 RepID=UPI003D223C0D
MIGVNEKGLRVGQDHQRAKLSDAAVELIRKLHEEGMSYRVIAEKFEIAKSTVQDICTYRRRAQIAAKWRTAD